MGAISLEDVCVSYSERRTYWKWFLEICDEPAGNVGQGQAAAASPASAGDAAAVDRETFRLWYVSGVGVGR